MDCTRHWAVFIQLIALLNCTKVAADDSRGIRLGEETTSKWRFGVVVKAAGGSVSCAQATLPVPMEWPEQTVKKIGEEKTPQVGAITNRVLGDGVKQMVVTVPRLAVGEEASAVITLQITKRRIEAPRETSIYQIPKPSHELARFLAPSPYIESKDPKIKSLATELTTGKQQPWEQVTAIFDWVRANVKYEFAEQIKPATAALKDGQGDCEELSSVS